MLKLLILLFFSLVISKSAEPLVAFYQGEKWHFLDSDGKTMFENNRILDVNGYNEGLYNVVADVKGEIKNCFMNTKGELVIITNYDEIKDFNFGKALVINNYPEELIDKRYGFINKDGKVFIKPSLIDATYFTEGLAYIYDENRRGYIDTNGLMKISLEDGIVGYPFSEGIAAISNKEYKVSFINKLGKQILPFDYQEPAYFVGGLAKANIDGVVGLMDITGKIVINPQYSELNKFSEGCSFVGILGAGMKYNWALIDSTGQKLTQNIFKDVQYFSGGFCGVKENEEWYFIDKTGKTVLRNDYTYCGYFSGKNPIAWISYRIDNVKMSAFINTKGEEVIKLPNNIIKAIDLRVNKEMY
jgi:ligand-binding SRPBCC domain-containing protein